MSGHAPAARRATNETAVRPLDRDARGAPLPSRRRTSRPGRAGSSFTVVVLLALGVALVLQTFVARVSFISSGSMEPTLMRGDRVLVDKLSYRFRAPDRGEVVAFQGEIGTRGDGDFVKRVIALPGETVEVREGEVLVDGVPLAQPYAVPGGDDLAPFVVPADEYFVLGDNRGSSFDSRDPLLGTVARSELVGRVAAVVWPPERLTRLGGPS